MLTSRAGVEVTADPSTISTEAKRIGALGIAVVTFGQQFHGSVRNFRKLRRGDAPREESENSNL